MTPNPSPTPPAAATSLVIRGASQVVSSPDGGPPEVVAGGAVLCAGDRIAWVGTDGAWPEALAPGPGCEVLDAAGGVITAGLVECHTHIVFAGSRAGEFARRLAGEDYAEILRQGGGILGTVRHTRAASDGELRALARARLESLLSRGVTTVEVKSGYGLDAETELRILRVVRDLDREGPWDLVPTFLGAHTVPAERRSDRGRYVDEVVEEMLPRVVGEGLARFCDVFCEREAFSAAESRRILTRARDLGLGLKVHAEQITRAGGAALAAELGATSADHLERVEAADVEALAGAGVTAVLLPGAMLFLRSAAPPARALRGAGVRVAVSTDWNPGTSPTPDLLLMGTLGCLAMGLTLEEALAGITAHAARAVGLEGDRGQVRIGARADLAVFRVTDWRELFYALGHRPASAVVKDGRIVFRSDGPS